MMEHSITCRHCDHAQELYGRSFVYCRILKADVYAGSLPCESYEDENDYF